MNILDKIIVDKRIEVERRKKETPVEGLMERCAQLGKCRNFYKAVTRKNPRGLNVIAEIKKASPSAGVIREDFNPIDIALTYQRCGADAISCLTDEKYFQGRLEYIRQIKEFVDIPVLRKDFIVDKYQVYEARAAGADAILLIVEALKPGELIDLMIKANELTMGCLIEVHGAESLMLVRSMVDFPQKSYNVIGINNRDLATMEVDVNNTARLASLVDEPMSLVAESGIKTREHIEKLINVPVSAVLIGQTLCENPDIEAKFKELFG